MLVQFINRPINSRLQSIQQVNINNFLRIDSLISKNKSYHVTRGVMKIKNFQDANKHCFFSIVVARRTVDPEVRVRSPARDLQVLEQRSTLTFDKTFFKSFVGFPARDLNEYNVCQRRAHLRKYLIENCTTCNPVQFSCCESNDACTLTLTLIATNYLNNTIQVIV